MIATTALSRASGVGRIRRVSDVFECEIQARMRDINLGGHVDNVEAIRVLDEARLIFLKFGTGGADGLLRDVSGGVSDLVGSQRVDYRAEMRFAPFQPFLVRMWVGHVGRSSFTVEYELRMAADHAPALTAETSVVLWDRAAEASWLISEPVRASLDGYRGEPVPLRDRPGS
jgi:acyl-CoA thioester hydrolase